jgi:hypothetical protein
MIKLLRFFLMASILSGVHNIIFGQLGTISFAMLELGLTYDEVSDQATTSSITSGGGGGAGNVEITTHCYHCYHYYRYYQVRLSILDMSRSFQLAEDQEQELLRSVALSFSTGTAGSPLKRIVSPVPLFRSPNIVLSANESEGEGGSAGRLDEPSERAHSNEAWVPHQNLFDPDPVPGSSANSMSAMSTKVGSNAVVTGVASSEGVETTDTRYPTSPSTKSSTGADSVTKSGRTFSFGSAFQDDELGMAQLDDLLRGAEDFIKGSDSDARVRTGSGGDSISIGVGSATPTSAPFVEKSSTKGNNNFLFDM